MFTKMLSKFSAVVLGVSVAAVSLTGCGSLESSDRLNMENDLSNQSSTNSNLDNSNSNSNLDNNNISNENTQQQSSDERLGEKISFKEVPLPPRDLLPLQKDSSGNYLQGVFYNGYMSGQGIDPGNNVWLIQVLSDKGHNVQVEEIRKVGNTYNIYVNIRYDYDVQYNGLPLTFGFFQASKTDMPGTAEVKVYDVDNPGTPLLSK